MAWVLVLGGVVTFLQVVNQVGQIVLLFLSRRHGKQLISIRDDVSAVARLGNGSSSGGSGHAG